MKIDYLGFTERVVGHVTSYGAIMCYALAFLIWMVFTTHEQDLADLKQAQIDNSICYSRGHVVVSTDAGKRCADPSALGLLK